MADWKEAAERYGRPQQVQAEAIPPERGEQLDRVATQLERFLAGSLGREALELLDASHKIVVFGERALRGGGTLWYLCGRGLRVSRTPPSWTAYSNDPYGQTDDSTTAQMAVRAAVEYSRRDPENIICWLRAELDKIAAAAPGQAK